MGLKWSSQSQNFGTIDILIIISYIIDLERLKIGM